MKLAPYILEEYGISADSKEMRTAIRYQFTKQGNLSDIRKIDELTMTGDAELVDILRLFKTKMGVLKYLQIEEKEETLSDRDFVQSLVNEFLANTRN